MFHVKHFEKLAEFARQNQIKYGEREQKQFEDLCSLLVEENLVEQMKYIYGKGLKRLKDKVLGSNATYMIH